jgi:hypothetical protein
MFFTTTPRRTRRLLTMIYMTRIQNISFFLLKVNNPSVRHPVWPRLALHLALFGYVWPRLALSLALSGSVWPRLALRLALSGSV